MRTWRVVTTDAAEDDASDDDARNGSCKAREGVVVEDLFLLYLHGDHQIGADPVLKPRYDEVKR